MNEWIQLLAMAALFCIGMAAMHYKLAHVYGCLSKIWKHIEDKENE